MGHRGCLCPSNFLYPIVYVLCGDIKRVDDNLIFVHKKDIKKQIIEKNRALCMSLDNSFFYYDVLFVELNSSVIKYNVLFVFKVLQYTFCAIIS